MYIVIFAALLKLGFDQSVPGSECRPSSRCSCESHIYGATWRAFRRRHRLEVFAQTRNDPASRDAVIHRASSAFTATLSWLGRRVEMTASGLSLNT